MDATIPVYAWFLMYYCVGFVILVYITRRFSDKIHETFPGWLYFLLACFCFLLIWPAHLIGAFLGILVGKLIIKYRYSFQKMIKESKLWTQL